MRPRAFSIAIALLSSGCASGAATLDRAVAICSTDHSSSHHVEVYISRARVVRVFGDRRTGNGSHEGFSIEALDNSAHGNGIVVRVEDNTDITGYIPLRSGEAVSLLGQYECDDGVIHWTHHDPRGRHLSGYIKADGATYQ